MAAKRNEPESEPDSEQEYAQPALPELPMAEEVYGHYMQQCDKVLLPTHEEFATFCNFRDHMFIDAAPADALEGMLVDRLVALLWRLRRAGDIERQLFERMERVQTVGERGAEHDEDPANTLPAQIMNQMIDTPTLSDLEWLQGYEAQLDRSVYQALRELRMQQVWRLEREKREADAFKAG